MTAPARAAIISPSVDALCTGGLSLLVLVPLLLAGRTDLLLLSAGVQAWLGALVNMPHFLASYRMVYRTRASIRAHPWAAVYVPSILVSCCIAAVVASPWTEAPITTLLTISSSYLALHYTGQAWGMTATFTYLAGASFNPLERRLVRGSLYILMAWHVVWYLRLGYYDYINLTPVYEALSLLTAVALAMGLAGFSLHRARTGRLAPLRAWIPWVAIFVWYAAMARMGLPALFIVQIAHAVQYLIFPFRVEVNRTRRGPPGGEGGGGRPGAGGRGTPQEVVAVYLAAYLVALLAGSILAAIVLPLGAMAVVTSWLGSRPGEVAGFAISAFFNIHHYFTDGVVWKLRDPAVREDLFGHLAQPAPVRAVAPAPPPPSPPGAAGALTLEPACRLPRPSLVVYVKARATPGSGPRNHEEMRTMRFMIIVKASKESEAGILPDEKILTEMGKFNIELEKAGVMLAGEGLQASSKGARVRFDGSKRTVIDGPFAETKELVAGFWIWQVKSKEEAIAWLKRAPFREGEVEIRQVFEAEDFGPALKPEFREQEERMRAQAAAKRRPDQRA